MKNSGHTLELFSQDAQSQMFDNVTQFFIKDEKYRQRFYGFFWYKIHAPFELFGTMLRESQQKILMLVNFVLPIKRKSRNNFKKKTHP